jgi:hypothetical protein
VGDPLHQTPRDGRAYIPGGLVASSGVALARLGIVVTMRLRAGTEQVGSRDGQLFCHRRKLGAFGLVGLLALILIGSLLASATPSVAASVLSWASPVRVDDQPPFESPAAITGVSCPSTGLCIAVDSVGDVLASTDPAGGARTWDKTYAGENSTGAEHFTGVSCPSAKLCVAVDDAGDVVTSTDPIGGAWTKTKVDVALEGESVRLVGVSCAPSGLCVATDAIGDVLTSTDPAGGAGAWTKTKVAKSSLGGVSCPSVRLCVAGATEGELVSSTDPTGGEGAWSDTDVNVTTGLFDVSCVSETLCVASNGSGVLTSTEPTGGQGAWKATNVGGGGSIEHVSCASWGLCVALGGNKVIASTEPTGGESAWTATSIELNGDSLEAASCPEASLCVLTDGGSAVVTSTEPTKGAGAWLVSDLEVGSSALRGVSCVGGGLCVAVDAAGNVVTSTDPAGGAGGWADSHVDSRGGLESVACPTTKMCAAVDSAGDVVTSTDPAGGASAWTVVDVDKSRRLKSVSCPSASLCVAIDSEGGFVTSTDPTGGTGAWSVTEMGSFFGLLSDLSCPSVGLCVAVGGGGDNVMTLTEPGKPTGRAWSVTQLDLEVLLTGVSCASVEACILVDLGDGVWSSTDPTGGTGAWTESYIEGLNGLEGVSCEVAGLCVANAFAGNGSAGNVIASTDPRSGANSWVKGNVYGLPVRPPDAPFELYTEDLTGVSCASGLCVVIDTEGDVMVGTRLDAAPVNISSPMASGTPALGQALSCANGSWTGYPSPVFSYQWLRNGTPISGANASTYVVQTADQGHGLTCQITAMNSVGSESATSNTLQVPHAQAPGGSGGSSSGGPVGSGSSDGSDNPGTLAGTVSNAFVLNGIGSVARHGTVKITLSLPGPGTLAIVGKTGSAQPASASHMTTKRKATVVIARVELTVSKAGRIVVTLAPTASAKAILVRQGKLRAAVTITYTPKGGTPRSIVRTVTFRLKRRR